MKTYTSTGVKLAEDLKQEPRQNTMEGMKAFIKQLLTEYPEVEKFHIAMEDQANKEYTRKELEEL